MNFAEGTLFVAQAVEQTAKFGVRFKCPKSKSSARRIPLAPEVVALLRDHRERQSQARAMVPFFVDNDLVFCNDDGTTWPPNTLTAQFGALHDAAGMHGFRLHDLRHWFATMLLELGYSVKEVQVLMGHSTASTTLNVYARSVEGIGRVAMNDLAKGVLGQAPLE